MKIDITARHFSLSDHLRILVNEKVDKIEKFNNGILSCSVVLTKDSSEENVEIGLVVCIFFVDYGYCAEN